jgi:hypothetical protein
MCIDLTHHLQFSLSRKRFGDEILSQSESDL